MLLDRVREYETGADEFSLREHRELFDEHGVRTRGAGRTKKP
jgi:hypothetical protein